jgi:hypothetical protein
MKSNVLNKMLQRGRKGNPLDRLSSLEQKSNAAFRLDPAADNLADVSRDLGTIVQGEFIAPADTATSMEVTDTGFTGAAMGGNGWTFEQKVFNFAVVKDGKLRAGATNGGQFIGKADALEINWWLPITLADDDITYIHKLVLKTVSGVKYLYAGGKFGRIGGINAKNIARYNFSTRQWAEVNGGVNDTVREIAFRPSDDLLFIGGYFTDAGGSATADCIAADNGAGSWTNVNGGVTEASAPCVLCITWSPAGVLYIGGHFANAGGDALADDIAYNNGGTWANVNGGVGTSFYVRDIKWDANNVLYVGGYFTNAGGDALADGIAKDNGGAWVNVNGGFSGAGELVTKIDWDANGTLYVAGLFTNAGGNALADNITKDNGGTWTNIGSGLNDVVHDFIFDENENIIAVGKFSNAGGDVLADRIALFDGVNWAPICNGGGLSGLGEEVWAVLEDTNKSIYAGGEFNTAGSIKCIGVAAYVSPLSDALDIIAGLFEQYQAKSVRSYSGGAIADDTAVSFTPWKTNGILIFGTQGTGSWGTIFFNTAGTCTALNIGATTAVSTSVLTGTTGTNGIFTVSATGGKIYLENRIGSSRTAFVQII